MAKRPHNLRSIANEVVAIGGEVAELVGSTRSGGGKKLKVEEVVPAAARTISSLRDIGYELPQAIADLVDNSVSAGASCVNVDLIFDGTDSWIRVSDNGSGMDTSTLTEALRYGSVRDYDGDDLGKFGFGLKTASTSQCRRVVVASRRSPERARIEARALDLEHIEKTDRWEILIVDPSERPAHLTDPLQETTGTVVLWEDLDRVLDYKDPWGGWAKRKLLEQAEAVAEHLGMVFHRFISGEVKRTRLKIFVNGSKVEAWDPFCKAETATTPLPEHDFRVASENGVGIVRVRPYVLPEKGDFSDVAAWQRASGPLKWNRQQGFYVYRANRLIQWGGWSRMRTSDEHLKLARVAIDFSPDLDSTFGINISKAIVKLPSDLRSDLEPVVAQVVRVANQRYRKESKSGGPSQPSPRPSHSPPSSSARRGALAGGSGHGGNPPQPPPVDAEDKSAQSTRQAIEEAARAAGEQEALEKIVASLRRTAPEVAHELGW
ncbi:ATP-binding protein [Mycolicibacterium sp. Y3]